MEFGSIQKGKKYFKEHRVKGTRGKKTTVSVIPVFVIDKKDGTKKEVLASVNGQPAKWFNAHAFRHWYES